MKSTSIGKRTFVSDFRLPGNIEIIFFSLEIRLFKSAFDVFGSSIKGCPTKVLVIFSSSKYFFSKLNNKRT